MPILRPSLLAAALAVLAAPVAAQTNPLAGDTQAPRTPQTKQAPAPAAPAGASAVLTIPAAARGQLLPDPDNADTGGVAFADELGWYRFTMPNGGTIGMAGPMRSFTFEAGLETKCAAQRMPDASFAAFSMGQIQAEIETLYPSFDQIVASLGFEIDARKTMMLDHPGQPSPVPLKILAWDTHDADGIRATWAMMPAPAGVLLFACSAGSDFGHNREVMQRYLRIGSEMLTPAK